MAYFFKNAWVSDVFVFDTLFEFEAYGPLDLSLGAIANPYVPSINLVDDKKGPLFAPNDGPLFAIINGTSGDDTLNGTAADDTINGLGGNDTINGMGGTDTIDAGAVSVCI